MCYTLLLRYPEEGTEIVPYCLPPPRLWRAPPRATPEATCSAAARTSEFLEFLEACGGARLGFKSGSINLCGSWTVLFMDLLYTLATRLEAPWHPEVSVLPAVPTNLGSL